MNRPGIATLLAATAFVCVAAVTWGSGDSVQIPRTDSKPVMGDVIAMQVSASMDSGAVAIPDSGAVPVEPPPNGIEVTGFLQREPHDGDPVSEPTKAYVSYDEDNLHVVFICEDDPHQVRARVVPRDKITDDDRVVIYLDTFADKQRAYVFEANPLGIQRDGMITEGQDDDYVFDALWYSEGRLTPTGYVVRIRIPFASLRFSEKAVQTWGIALGRHIERKSEKAYWPHITDRIEGFVNQLGSAQGLSEIAATRGLQIVPYTVMANARFLDDQLDVPAFRSTQERRFGVDLKAVVRDAVTIDVAVRPDFSQVEPDDPQVTVNERFEVRVDEKRPFFIENAGYFETPIELFFSRRIVDPSGGARVTSKLGAWVVGALAMDDREPGIAPVDDPLHGKRAYAGVVRVQHEFPGQTTAGMFASDRELAGDFNRVYGADVRFKVGKNWVGTGQIAQAETRDSEEGLRFWGSGGLAKIRRDGRHFDFSSKYTQFSPDFEAQLGFVRRVGYREVDTDLDYTFKPKKSIVTAWGPALGATFNWDMERRLQDAEVKASTAVELPADTQVEMSWAEVFELFEDQEFRLREFKAMAETKWLKWLGLHASYTRGLEVNHDPADTIPGVPGGVELLPFSGHSQEANFEVTLRPTSRLEFKQSLTYGWLRHYEYAPDWVRVSPVFDNWILKSRLKFQVNRELSLRAIANYEALIPNPELSDEDEERNLVPDFLATYMVNPWTALHAGYTERFQNVEPESGEVVESPRVSRQIAVPPTSVVRQFFLKFSYLFRM